MCQGMPAETTIVRYLSERRGPRRVVEELLCNGEWCRYMITKLDWLESHNVICLDPMHFKGKLEISLW